MVSEEEKFRAETYRITGFALLTPVGRIFLDPLPFFREYGLAFSLGYLILAVVLGIIGFFLIEIARVILYIKRFK